MALEMPTGYTLAIEMFNGYIVALEMSNGLDSGLINVQWIYYSR